MKKVIVSIYSTMLVCFSISALAQDQVAADTTGANDNTEVALKKDVLESIENVTKDTISVDTAKVKEISAIDFYRDAIMRMKSKEYEYALPLFERSISKLLRNEEQDSVQAAVLASAKVTASRAAFFWSDRLMKTKKYDEALLVVSRGLNLDDFFLLYSQRAKILDKLEQPEAAITAYLTAADKYRAVGLGEEKYLSFYSTAFNRMLDNKMYDQLIASAKEHPEALHDAELNHHLGLAYNAKKDYENAVICLSKASEMIAKDDENAASYYMMEARINIKLGREVDALAAYKKVPKGSKYAVRAEHLIERLQSKIASK